MENMDFSLPSSRRSLRSIQTQKRNVPIEQIIAVRGRSPVATGIGTLGQVLGQALQQKAMWRMQGRQVTQAAKLMGQEVPANTMALTPEMYLQAMKTKKDESRYQTDVALKLKQMEDLQDYRNKLLSTKGGGGGEKPLSQFMTTQIARAESGIQMMEKAVGMYDPSFTGPIQGRLSLIETIPGVESLPFIGKQITDPKRGIFLQNVKMGAIKFLYSEAGKQLSDREIAFVYSVIDNPNLPDARYLPQLKNAIELLKMANDKYKKTLAEAGWKVPGYDKTDESMISDLLKEGLVTE